MRAIDDDTSSLTRQCAQNTWYHHQHAVRNTPSTGYIAMNIIMHCAHCARATREYHHNSGAEEPRVQHYTHYMVLISSLRDIIIHGISRCARRYVMRAPCARDAACAHIYGAHHPFLHAEHGYRKYHHHFLKSEYRDTRARTYHALYNIIMCRTGRRHIRETSRDTRIIMSEVHLAYVGAALC